MNGAIEQHANGGVHAQSGGIAVLDPNPGRYDRRLHDALGRVNPDNWSVTALPTLVLAR